MHKSIEQIGKLYGMNTGLFPRVIDEISTEHLVSRPMDAGNSIRHILGHVTGSRHLVTRLLGDDQTYPYSDLFGRGKELQDVSVYPSVEEIMRLWNDISGKMMTAIESASEELLLSEAEIPAPGDPNVIGKVSFLLFHESYHLGQIVHIRRLFGYSRVFG